MLNSPQVSKYNIDFKLMCKEAPLNQTVTDTVALEAKMGKIKYAFHGLAEDPRYILSVVPSAGKFKVVDCVFG
jgi:hypothetical protein